MCVGGAAANRFALSTVGLIDMGAYRFEAKIIKRSEGRSATAAAAYRAGAVMYDERLGETWDYSRKRGILHSEIVAPDNAPEWMRDRAQLWNAVERVEKRRDAQLARDITVSLPHELTHEQRVELLRSFVTDEFVSKGMIADFSLHAPDRGGDDRNYHAHVMLTMRNLTGEGFGNKNRDWNDRFHFEDPQRERNFEFKDWRGRWANAVNRAYAEYGIDAFVDHRSYAERGIDREPEPKQGPIATEMERQGRKSHAGDDRREAKARNATRAGLEEAIRTLEDSLRDLQGVPPPPHAGMERPALGGYMVVEHYKTLAYSHGVFDDYETAAGSASIAEENSELAKLKPTDARRIEALPISAALMTEILCQQDHPTRNRQFFDFKAATGNTVLDGNLPVWGTQEEARFFKPVSLNQEGQQVEAERQQEAAQAESARKEEQQRQEAARAEQARQDEQRRQEEAQRERLRKEEETRAAQVRQDDEKRQEEARKQQARQDDERRQAALREQMAAKLFEAASANQLARQLAGYEEVERRYRENQEIQQYLAEQQRLAKQEEDRRIQSALKVREGDITNSHIRYGEALQQYSINDHWGSLARVATTEHALFCRGQQDLARQIAQEADPTKRRDFELRKEIEGYDYMIITSERLAKLNRIITGRGPHDTEGAKWDERRQDSADAQRDERWAKEWSVKVQELREERVRLLEAQARQSEQEAKEKQRQEQQQKGQQEKDEQQRKEQRRQEYKERYGVKGELTDEQMARIEANDERARKIQDQEKERGRSRSRGGRSR
jgi:hypothetical protein